MKKTLCGVGRAMLITTAIVSLGFTADISGTLSNVRAFGCMIAVTVAVALIADLLIAPSLMIVTSRFSFSKGNVNEIIVEEVSQ